MHIPARFVMSLFQAAFQAIPCDTTNIDRIGRLFYNLDYNLTIKRNVVSILRAPGLEEKDLLLMRMRRSIQPDNSGHGLPGKRILRPQSTLVVRPVHRSKNYRKWNVALKKTRIHLAVWLRCSNSAI